MADIKFIPGVHPTYREQFDKLTRAYIADEVNPYSPCACFVGNLLNRDINWIQARNGCVGDKKYTISRDKARRGLALNSVKLGSNGLYSLREIYDIEFCFMCSLVGKDEEDEDVLFDAFSKTLDLLRQIHESKGEIIDAVPAFTKRELKTA